METGVVQCKPERIGGAGGQAFHGKKREREEERE